MNNVHVLLEKARKYNKKKQSEQLHRDYRYCPSDGFWSAINGGGLLMKTALFALCSKKEDVETGEDRKGE